METYHNLIGGQWTASRSGQLRPNLNPSRSSEILAQFPDSDPLDLQDAVSAAATAYPGWRRMGLLERGEILYRASDLLAARVDAIARDLSLEEGKTFIEAKGETMRAAAILRYYAGEARQETGEVYAAADPRTMLYTRREPLGIVGVITPWNFPISIPAWKIAPALVYGNSVVWKPADLTPLTSYHLTQVLLEAGLPEGVLNVVYGRGSVLGTALVNDPQVHAISFTGSNGVGRSIGISCASRGAKYQLEMGGKNAAVVLSDADLELAVEMTVRGAMRSSGQKCTATSRVIVEAPLMNAFTEALVDRCRTLQVGDPFDPKTYLGPLASLDQQQTVLNYIQIGQLEGARLVSGGDSPDSNGYFVSPTVFMNVKPESRLTKEEIFGPVVSVVSAVNLSEAIALVNQSNFGLSTSVFTRDVAKAMHFIDEADCGIVHVNSETAGAEPHVPFGGMKESSSNSREQGKSAKEFYSQIKTVYLDSPSITE
ncbi:MULTISPECIES: aldehyde dehydrogenase family protein [unclassified Paenibacillus]|uniref:aldehyde dehydrogenase family protein n=1 Tax=unclassified Paenibacillus TaxID=185978 RepID=UPI00070CD542|nr:MULTISPECIES: aldehyde dehydrogenase family protein [unclassified Paenibacillus]KQX48842.1 aldehyde dehydrogenase [Paenibacillus sp. Root444D2]KRE36461.1 aldehyde dehydrogenase [Paenibacillus sp. Soil724D2]